MVVGALAALLASAVSALVLAGLSLVDTLPWPLWLGLGGTLAAFLLVLAVLALRQHHLRRFRERSERYDRHLCELDNEQLHSGEIDIDSTLTTVAGNLEISTGTPVGASLRRPSPAGAQRTWDLSAWPSHTPPERLAYETPVDNSWLGSVQRGQPDERLFRIDDLSASNSPGADLDALRRFGFETVVCARVAPARPGDGLPTPCLVVVAKQAGVFTELELSYLRSVARLIERHLESAG